MPKRFVNANSVKKEYLKLSLEKNTHHSCGNSDKSDISESNHEEISRKHNLKSILRNSQPVIFKNAKVVILSVNERLTNGSRMKEPKETWKLNKTCDSELNLLAVKDIIESISKLIRGL